MLPSSSRQDVLCRRQVGDNSSCIQAVGNNEDQLSKEVQEKILARQLQLEEERRLYDELERNRIETAQLNMTRQNEASQHPSRMKLLGHARQDLQEQKIARPRANLLARSREKQGSVSVGASRTSPVDETEMSIENRPIIQPTQKPIWIPDTASSTCMECDARFTFVKRRHHCRCCGRLLCNDCCNVRVKMPSLGFQGSPQRSCQKCVSKFFWQQVSIAK